jgi:hypothetical protein
MQHTIAAPLHDAPPKSLNLERSHLYRKNESPRHRNQGVMMAASVNARWIERRLNDAD